MGSVFGKSTVASPLYTTLHTLQSAPVPFEVRQYGQRYAVSTTMVGDGGFMTLAGYIGVGTSPQNEGAGMTQPSPTVVAMTAPVVTKNPKAVAMTSPVTTSTTPEGTVMSFILPAEYDSLEKIPKPTNPAVRIVAVPPSIGAVSTFSGTVTPLKSTAQKTSLLNSLTSLGVTPSNAADWELWRYDPPWTLPWFRRNEIYVPLTEEEVAILVQGKGGV